MEKENITVDYEQLAKFVDALIVQKNQNAKTAPDNDSAVRDAAIKELSDRIDDAIFSQLDSEQTKNLEYLLEEKDGKEKSPAEYQDFFKGAGINLEETAERVMIEFGKEFLGGDNE